MFLGIQRVIVIICSLFLLLSGKSNEASKKDSICRYKENVNSLTVFDNTIDHAVAQTEVYGLIKSHFTSPLPEGKTEKKAIVLGYDGCRLDALTLLKNEKASAINTLLKDGGQAVISYCGGQNYDLINTQKTSTAPGWCSMLTGEWGKVTGVTDNGISKSNEYPSLLTTLVEDKIAADSAFYVSWNGHFSEKNSTYINEKKYCEEKGLDVAFLCAGDDNGTTQNIMTDIASENCSDFIFSIFEYCDHAGHDTGFGLDNPDYVKAFYDSEQVASSVIEAIKARPTYSSEDWLIVITSDHGGFITSHGNITIQERMTFIVTNKNYDYKY